LKDFITLWLDQVCESELTKDGYTQSIRHFEKWATENHNLAVMDIPLRWREATYGGPSARDRFLDELKDVLRGYFAGIKGHYSPTSVNRMMSTLMSYLHTYEVPIKPIRLKHAYVQYHNRDITKEEVQAVLDHSNVRDKAICVMLYESGMRPNTLTKLRWRHIKDDFSARKIPMMIKLSSDILKCHVTERWTFIGDEGYQALHRYLSTRRPLPLKEGDFIFAKEKPKGGKLGATALSQAFNKKVKKLRLAEPEGADADRRKPKEIRLYCLRKAFRKYMAASTDSRYVEFWMGHTSTETHYLSTDPEYHRQLYAKGYPSLRIGRPSLDVETVSKLTGEIERLGSVNQEYRARIERLERMLSDLADAYAEVKQLRQTS